MKVFMSVDIEGITTTTSWDEVIPVEQREPMRYNECARRMTKEAVAACEGAIEAGATEILLRDAHCFAQNIDIEAFPKEVKFVRGWSGSPYMMVDGIDETFDAAVFVGYHSAASRSGNPLSHTETRKLLYVKINGRIASEFMLFSYAALTKNVPTVFLSGDKMLCDDYANLHPQLVTVPVKEGKGAATICYNPSQTLIDIKEGVKKALDCDLTNALGKLPKHFEMEICYKDHALAEKYSYFPGVTKINDNTVKFVTDDYYKLLQAFVFISG